MEKKEVNLFEVASRQRFRFPFKGLIMVEDLWNLELTDLDYIFKQLNSLVRVGAEDSLLDQRSKDDEKLVQMIDIIKHIVKTKQDEEAAKVAGRAKLLQRKKILGIKAAAEDAALMTKSPEELQAMLDALDE